MHRCCDPTAYELRPCYASVLVAGHDLGGALEKLEEESIISPCVTSWCSACRRVSLLVQDAGLFPTPSAHLAHSLAVHRMAEEFLRVADENE